MFEGSFALHLSLGTKRLFSAAFDLYLSVGLLKLVDAAFVKVSLRQSPRLQVFETSLDQLCLGLRTKAHPEQECHVFFFFFCFCSAVVGNWGCFFFFFFVC